MRNGEQMREGRPARLAAWGIRFFLAATLTAAQTPGEYAPFALGFAAACGPGGEGAAALIGAAAGAVLFLDFAAALPFLASAVLIFTTAAAFQGLRLMEGDLFRPLTGAGFFLAVHGIYVLQAISPLRHLAPFLAGAVLTGLAGWYYQPLLRAGEERLELSPEEGILLDLGQGQCGYITQQAISEERLRKYLSRPGNQGAGIGEKSVRAEELSQEIQTCIAKAYQFFVTPQNRLCRRLEEKKAAALLEKVQKSVWEDRWEQVCEQLGEMEREGMDFFTVRSAVKLCNIIFTGSLFREEETDYYIYGIRQLVTEYGNLRTMLESLRAAILAARTEGAEENYTNAAFMKLMVYIKENYKKEISLSTAGEALHMNPNYVSQLFKKEAGITFIHYITQLRMEEAVNLLSMTKKPVVEIASEVGYNDYFYFCKTFKKYMGKTPSRYREEC